MVPLYGLGEQFFLNLTFTSNVTTQWRAVVDRSGDVFTVEEYKEHLSGTLITESLFLHNLDPKLSLLGLPC